MRSCQTSLKSEIGKRQAGMHHPSDTPLNKVTSPTTADNWSSIRCHWACKRFNNAGDAPRRKLVEMWKE